MATLTRVKIIPEVVVTGCRADCPHTRYYDPNQDGETLGCSFAYGTLPQEGFAPWCLLRDAERELR